MVLFYDIFTVLIKYPDINRDKRYLQDSSLGTRAHYRTRVHM